MNAVQARLGGPPVPSVTAPLRTAGRLVCTLKGLDPYKDQRRDPVIGPIEGLLPPLPLPAKPRLFRSEEHTSELQSLMRISYAVFCLKKKKKLKNIYTKEP